MNLHPLLQFQWHGRTLAIERRGWPVEHTHRVVHYIADVVTAPNEVAALVAMQGRYPDARTTGFFYMGPVKLSRK